MGKRSNVFIALQAGIRVPQSFMRWLSVDEVHSHPAGTMIGFELNQSPHAARTDEKHVCDLQLELDMHTFLGTLPLGSFRFLQYGGDLSYVDWRGGWKDHPWQDKEKEWGGALAAIGRNQKRFSEAEELVGRLHRALCDASSVVDKGEDEKYAYQREIEAAKEFLDGSEDSSALPVPAVINPVFAGEVNVIDPVEGCEVSLGVYKDPSTGGMFAVDSSFVEQTDRRTIPSPFEPWRVFALDSM